MALSCTLNIKRNSLHAKTLFRLHASQNKVRLLTKLRYYFAQVHLHHSEMGNTKSQSFEEPSVDYWWKQSSQSNISLDVNAPKPVCVKLKNKSVMSSSSSDQSGLNATFEQSNDDKLDEFRQDFARKHEKRRQLIAEKRKEMQDLRLELLRQKKENEKLRESLNAKSSEINPSTEIDQQLIENLKQENDEMKRKIVELQTELFRSETIAQKNNELRCSITELQRELQSLNAEVVNFEKERQDYQTHVTALKDVIKVSKEMLRIRESQLNEVCLHCYFIIRN